MTQVPYPTPTENQGLRVVKQRTELIVPHNGGELIFLHPPYRPNIYANVGLAIREDNSRRPTMAETASLVHAAFNSDDRYSAEIKRIMRKEGLWGFTGISYVPNEGAFFQDDPEIRKEMLFMDRNSLEQKINAKDPSVRFVPFGYPVGEMTSLQLAQNAYIIALAGEEGAEKLAIIADKYDIRPYLESFKSVDGNTIRVPSLSFHGRSLVTRILMEATKGNLVVDGNKYSSTGYARAFGVLDKTDGASRAKK